MTVHTNETPVRAEVDRRDFLKLSAATGALAAVASSAPALASRNRALGAPVFASFATNLVTGDTNAFWDAFARNVPTGQTRRVSVSSAGAQGDGHSGIFSTPRISADGTRIAFDSQATNLVAGDTNANLDVFLRNRPNQTTRRVSVRFDGTEGNAAAIVGDLASSGRFVSFLSNSTNLVGGDTNAFNDTFIRGRLN